MLKFVNKHDGSQRVRHAMRGQSALITAIAAGGLMYALALSLIPAVIVAVITVYVVWQGIALPITGIDVRHRGVVIGMIVGLIAGAAPGGLIGLQDLELDAPVFSLIVGVLASTLAAALMTDDLINDRYFRTHPAESKRTIQHVLTHILFGTLAALIMGRLVTGFFGILGGSEQVEVIGARGDVLGTALIGMPVGMLAGVIAGGLHFYDQTDVTSSDAQLSALIRYGAVISSITGGLSGLLISIFSQNIVFIIVGVGVGSLLGFVSGVLSSLLMRLTIMRQVPKA